MKDIDFDELDRAVSSLMGSPTVNEPESKKTETPLAPQQPIEPPVITAPEPVRFEVPAPAVGQGAMPGAVPVTTDAALKVQVPRRSGKFMDMVNAPVSGKPRPAVQAEAQIQSSTSSSREGLSITPRSELPVNPTSVQFSEPKDNTNDFPDPLDAVVENQDTITPIMSTPPVAPPVAQAIETTTSGESPFILDAKVSKRPLNAGSALDIDALNRELEAEVSLDEQRDSINVPTDVQTFDSTTDVSTEGADEPIEDPEVPELDTDLVAIEAKESFNDASVVTPAPTPELDADSSPVSSTVSTSTPLGASSIAQQYTSQPSSGDQSHAAIYDASQYPDTVTHPAKSKSGWLWVLWVLLLLGIGAGGALLLYSLGIIP